MVTESWLVVVTRGKQSRLECKQYEGTFEKYPQMKLILSSINLLLFCLFRATPVAYGGSQARGQIRATASSLYHSHSNAGSEPHLQPPPQLMATPDPWPTEQVQEPNPHLHGYQSGSGLLLLSHNGNSLGRYFRTSCLYTHGQWRQSIPFPYFPILQNEEF